MKISFILTLFFALQASATVYSQNKVLDLNLKNKTVREVLKTIESKTEFRFFYNDDFSSLNNIVDINVNQKGINEILDKILANKEVTYKVMSDNLVVILPTSEILQKKITGTVVDAVTGEAIIGANVIIDGTTIGVVTDARGRFSLDVPKADAIVVVSYLGYNTERIGLNGQSVLDIKLVADITKLEEVVVVGYGTIKKSDLTGSIASVKGNDLTHLPTMRADQALQGRAAGVSVQNTDGEPGGNVTIRIRGGNSVTGGNNALVVIDGVQGGNISTINPNDIESLEVLKDASATAIYGARGANGVILISTKKGVVGKPVFNYSYSYGTQTLGHKLDLLSAGDFARKANAYAATQNGTVASPVTPVLPFTDAQISALDNGGGTDWQNEIYRKGTVQNHLLSMSGGTENVRYFVSGGYLDQQGILINSAFKRYTLRSNLDLKLNKWITAGVNLNVIKDKGNVPPTGEGTYFGDILGQVINTVARFDPATPVYDAAGNYNFKALRGGPANNKGYADADVWNPVATAMETQAEKNNINSEVNTFLEFKLMEGLTFRVTGAASVYNMDNLNYYGSQTQPGFGTHGLGKLENEQDQYFQNSNILTYTKSAGKHRFTVTGVAEQQLTMTKYSYIEAQGFFSDVTGIHDLGGASQINTRTNSFTKTAINSFLGRANYAYDNKYLLTVSYRADGSSVFGDQNKWGYFPSASLAWKASEESFIKDLGVFSDLKIRGSWGKTGNQGIQPYQSLATIGSGYNYPYMGDGSTSIGFALVTAANPELKWETTTQTNLGVDFGFFNDRLTANIDVYKKVTKDLLLNKQVPNYTGFASILSNVGSIENKGLEISIGARPVMSTDFSWSTNINVSFNRDKVLALASDAALPIITNTGGGYNIWKNGAWSLKNLTVGHPVEEMQGYVYLGTWSEAERADALKFGQLPGDPKWLDVNGDGVIKKADDGNQVIGKASPDYIYGWNNNLMYKSFELSFLIQGSQGNDIFNAVRIKTESPAFGTSANLNNRWTIDNQNTSVPAFTSTQDRNTQLSGHPSKVSGIGNDTRSSRWIEDGSYARLKNITFTYNFPTSLLGKVHISRLAAYVTATNLITLTKYTGYDPEVSSFNRGSRVRAGGLGIDLSNYPTAKSIIFGLNLTF
jgi:TonB-linked SusC/RagA family outer membrane protein